MKSSSRAAAQSHRTGTVPRVTLDDAILQQFCTEQKKDDWLMLARTDSKFVEAITLELGILIGVLPVCQHVTEPLKASCNAFVCV